MDTTEESTSPLSWGELIRRLCLRSKKPPKSVEKEFTFFLGHPVATLYKESRPIFYRLSLLASVKYMLVGKSRGTETNDRDCYDYMWDFRFAVNPEYYTRQVKPVYFVIDLDTGALLLETTNPAKIPPFMYWQKKREGIKAHLRDILQLQDAMPEGEAEPQTPEALLSLLHKHDLHRNVEISHCVNFGAHALHDFLTVIPDTPEDRAKPQIRFWAYPVSATKIRYAFYQPKKSHSADSMQYYVTPEHEVPPPKPDTVNRKLAVHVQLTGLTLAHKLGCCSLQELADITDTFSRHAGSLWITFDEEKHPRHVAFVSSSTADPQEKCITLDSCSDDNCSQWTSLLTFVDECGKEAREAKRRALLPVLERLELFVGNKRRDLWSKCHYQLETAIRRYKVFVYGYDDTALHALKVPVAGVFRDRQRCGVSVHTLANNTISGMSLRDLDFLNLGEYINYDGKAFDPWNDDVNLWKMVADWCDKEKLDPVDPSLVCPHLKHAQQRLRNQVSIKMLNKRGLRNAMAVSKLWHALVGFLARRFNYDLATKGHVSISRFSFDIVWLEYARLAGPLCHSFEMLHPYVEHLVRPFCNGGFSYSANDYVCEGKPLRENQEPASSICELDLTSAYGYSALSMSAPKGFAVNFGHGMHTQRRHNLFEFRAVFYTIHKWIYAEKRNIVSVFSNYSPLGIIYVGPYPLDLVGVFEDGTIELVQFDGHYCHGDYRQRVDCDHNSMMFHYDSQCPTLPRYSGDRSRRECEDATLDRDEYIINWMVSVNRHLLTYTVYTDCCDPEYNPLTLRQAFQTEPLLVDMVRGLDDVNGSLDFFLSKADDREFNRSVTFFALVDGYSKSNHLHEFGPVFCVDNETHERGTAHSGRFLLTADYYRYLVRHFDFCVTGLSWVAYYKRCYDFPRVYDRLVTLRRQVAKDSSVASLVKSIINYSCGYFGLHRSKHPFAKTRIVYSLPRNFNFSRHEPTPLPYFGDTDLYILKTFYPSSHLKNKSTTPLLHFFGIIEAGKLQINAAIQILQRHLRPTAFRVLYSNVDNLIVAYASEDPTGSLSDDSAQGLQAFLAEWLPLVAPEIPGTPGTFKEEWRVGAGHGWKFVTPFCMFYALTTADKSETHQKSSCFTTAVSEDVFQVALAIWNKERVSVDVEKRKNKLEGTDTHFVRVQVDPKPSSRRQKQQRRRLQNHQINETQDLQHVEFILKENE